MKWRLATSERISDRMVDIETLWSLDDVLDAHDALDLWEELERKSLPEIEKP